MNMIQELMIQGCFIKKVYLFNTSIITGGEGSYRMEKSSVEEFRQVISYVRSNSGEVVSAIGHFATAEIFSVLLEEKVEVNRIPAEQNMGELGLVLKMKGRIPEGTIITSVEEMEKVGYELYILHKEK